LRQASKPPIDAGVDRFFQRLLRGVERGEAPWLIGLVVALVLMLWLLIYLARRVRPMSKRRAIQHHLTIRAAEQSPTYVKRKRVGLVQWLIVLILLFLFWFAAWMAYRGNWGLHPWRP
jgi:hypothetical protein